MSEVPPNYLSTLIPSGTRFSRQDSSLDLFDGQAKIAPLNTIRLC